MSTTFSRHTLTRAAATFALAATITGLGAGVAAAGTPAMAPIPASSASTLTSTAAVSTDDSDPDGDMSAMSSRRITVTNMSGDTMKLTSVDGDKWFEGRPGDGSTIEPGRNHAWELTYKYAKTNADTVVYSLTKPDGTSDGSVTLDLRVSSNGYSDPSVTSSCKSIASKDGLQCTAGGDQVTLIDKAGTVRELDGSGPNQAAATVLQQMCDTGIGATCEFKATSEQARLGAARQVGAKLANPTDIQQSKSVTISDTTSSSDSLGGSVSLKIPIKPVELTIQTTYNHTWTTSHTFSETMPIQVPAKQWGWIETRTSYYQHTGNFTVKLGNTTWKINNVTIDSPNPNGEVVYIARNAPMTQQEIDDATGGGWTNAPQVLTAAIVLGND